MGMWAWCLEGEINDWVGIQKGCWWLQAFRDWLRIAGLTQSRPVYLRHTYIDIPVSLSLLFCSHRLYTKLEKFILARGTHRGGRVLIKGLMSMKCASLTLYEWLWWDSASAFWEFYWSYRTDLQRLLSRGCRQLRVLFFYSRKMGSLSNDMSTDTDAEPAAPNSWPGPQGHPGADGCFIDVLKK